MEFHAIRWAIRNIFFAAMGRRRKEDENALFLPGYCSSFFAKAGGGGVHTFAGRCSAKKKEARWCVAANLPWRQSLPPPPPPPLPPMALLAVWLGASGQLGMAWNWWRRQLLLLLLLLLSPRG